MGQNCNLNSLSEYDSVRFNVKIFDDDEKKWNSIVISRFINLASVVDMYMY